MRTSMNRRFLGGYTLIETAIVLSVVGVLGASFFSAYKLYLQRKVQNTTELNSTLVTSAISNFLIQRGRLPCPARIDAQRTDADYGLETQCDPAGAGYPAAVAGTNVNGAWYENSLTQVDTNPDPTITNIVTPKVRRGGVPFRTLALPEDKAFDGYGNRFNYAVTEPQAVTSSYQKGNGGIMIWNAADQPFFRVNVATDKIILYPDSQVTANSVTPNSNVHLVIDDVIDNDALSDTARCNNTATCIIRVTLSDPSGVIDPAGNFQLVIRAHKYNSSSSPAALVGTASGSAGNIEARLFTDPTMTTQIGATVNQPVPVDPDNASPFAMVPVPFPVMPNASVPNWNTLFLQIRHIPASSGTKRGVAISGVKLEVDRLPGLFVDYFLFSSGKDQAGAYSRWGQMVRPCPAVGLDRQNCDTTTQAIYRMADRSEAVGKALHFDDFIRFFNSVEVPLWRVSGAGAHIRDLLNVESTGGKIALAQSPNLSPAAPVLQVNGEVRAVNANAMVGQICDTGAGNCFAASNLADPVAQATDFTCPAGQYAVGFEFGVLKCSPDQNTPCGSGQVVTGIASDGTLQCTSIVGCPTQNINLCYNPGLGTYQTHTLPAGIQGQTYTTPPSGYNYTENWTCGPNPYWQRTGTAGICNCNPVDEIQTVPCTTALGGNYTGNATRRHQHFCPADTDQYDPWNTSACVCADTTETYVDNAACGAGFTGSITYQRTWSCATMTWSAWTVAPGGNNCTCVNQPSETRSRTCPAGQQGTWQQQRDFTCPAGTWSGWYDTTNTCACVNGLQDGPYALSCPSGYAGTKSQVRYFNCTTNSYDPWVVTDLCTCTPDHQEADFNECPTAFSGTVHKQRDFTCPAGSWSSWSVMSNTCTCTGASENRTISCTAPLAGTKDQRRDYDCGTNSWGGWYDTADNCYVQTYNWTPKVSATGPFATSLSVRAGDTCTTLNASTPCCSQAEGGNGWYHYAECKCE